jgi:hypothetical protein
LFVHLISDEQHDFVGGHSTVTFDAVYTDISNAFDRVNHGLLLGMLTRKLHRPLIFWMGSYLTRRTRGGLGPKSLRGNRFFKGHRDIAEKASHHFKKVSISLKLYLKCL